MSAFFDDQNHTSPLANGPKRWRRDFADLREMTSFAEDYRVLIASHQPVAISTAHATERNFYLTDESALRPLGGGLAEFTREYAKIPSGRRVPQSQGWKVPGLGSENPPGAFVGIDSASASSGQQTFQLDADPSVSAGGTVAIEYVVSTNTQQLNRRVMRGVVSASSSSVTIASPVTDNLPISWLRLQSIEPGRDAEVHTVPSVIQFDYFLPGINVPSLEEIDILNEDTEIYDNTGRKTDTFTETTSPTLLEWRTKTSGEEMICCERSLLRVWKGNIYERQTRYTKAI
jgi:hypothetical protein